MARYLDTSMVAMHSAKPSQLLSSQFTDTTLVVCHAGGRADQVIKVLVFMTDIAERASINPIRQRYFGEHRPASTLVEVKALVDPRMKVEIEAMAYVGT